jgi:methionyl-tRNA formyltransferase
MTKIAVFAYSLVGHQCLQSLIDAKEKVVGVFTHPDASTETLWFPSVAQLAKGHKIPVMATEDPKDPMVLEALQIMQPDLIFSFYYRKMIPKLILGIPHLGAFNMHGSLLPRYRGCAPANWVLVHGETETGVTLHHMVQSADVGNMVDWEAFPISPTDTAFDVTQHLSEAAARVLQRQLPALKEGRAPSIPQDNAQATYFGRRTPADSQIDWRQPSWQVHNLIRAVPYPYFPPAFTQWQGEKIEVRANRLPQKDTRLMASVLPGQIVTQGEEWIRVACGDGSDFIDLTDLSVPLNTVKVGDVWGQ